jgi:hypothetical protein
MALILNEYGNIELQKAVREIEERLHRVECELFLKKSSGIDGSAGDWTQAGDGTKYPAVPTQAQADAVANEAEYETVFYEDGSSAYGHKPLPRVSPHGSPAKVSGEPHAPEAQAS